MIKINELNKIYRTGDIKVHALKDVNLEVKKGDFVSIIGASGSGKSTMMNIIGCLDSFDSGEYLLDDIDILKYKKENLAEVRNKKIGFIFQSFNLLPKFTALENVELPMLYAGVHKKERIKRAKEALAKVGLGDRMEHRPNELSGGQKQRVAVARALVNKPAVLLADEPTGNLDSHVEAEIIKLFQILNEEEGMTIVMVTHELSIAKKSKRVVTFKDGKIIKREFKDENGELVGQ